MSESKKSAQQIEQERLTRRQALRKLGFGAGLSAIMLLGADDLARMVGARMRQMEGDSKVADQIAEEFQSAGIAFAAGPSSPTPCNAWEGPNHDSSQCENCQNGQVMSKCLGQASAANCSTWSAQCDKFCGTGNYNDWWNCWNGYNSALP